MKTTCWSLAIVSPTLGALGKGGEKENKEGEVALGFGDGGDSALGEKRGRRGRNGRGGPRFDSILSYYDLPPPSPPWPHRYYQLHPPVCRL